MLLSPIRTWSADDHVGSGRGSVLAFLVAERGRGGTSTHEGQGGSMRTFSPPERYFIGRTCGLAAGLGVVLLMWGEVWLGAGILISSIALSYAGLRHRS